MRLYLWIVCLALFLDFFATIEIRENNLLSHRTKIKWLLLIWLLPYLGFLIYLTVRQGEVESDSYDGYIGSDEIVDYYREHHYSGTEHHDHGLNETGHDIN
jgi:hypothetical protein